MLDVGSWCFRFQPRLRPRMKTAMHRFQSLLVDVRVNLRRRNVGMPEHLLDDPEIGAVAEQMRRKTVPQQVRVDVGLEPGTLCVRFYDLPDARGGQSSAACGQKNFAATPRLHQLWALG